jgi:Na+-transporting methylmalonyl-CoA/oxaloacetate decarboxylase gamma subunit
VPCPDVVLLLATDRNLMRMYVILVFLALLLLSLSFLAAHLVTVRRAVSRERKREAVAARLAAVVAQAEEEHRARSAAARASDALTTVLPAIGQDKRSPRRVA